MTPLGFPDSSVGKESARNAEDPGLIPGLGRSSGEGIGYPLQYSWASLAVQLVKNLPAMRETWVRSLGWDDPLEKGKATPVFWPGEFYGLYSSGGRKELDTTERLSLFFMTSLTNSEGFFLGKEWIGHYFSMSIKKTNQKKLPKGSISGGLFQ